jgi:glyoxylase-like metal-dependent hydrolase (beta-lactamase superfamily II)
MDIQVHHLNCGTMCPRSRRLINGDGRWTEDARLVCHVLLVEGPDGLALVDTGFGTDDVRRANEMDRQFKALTRPRLQQSETAVEQVRQLGFEPSDVRHILMTHLDIDHAGGLPDFPEANVHLWARELQTMRDPPWRERRRYTMADFHWAHGPQWVTHEAGGDEWFGFESIRVLPGTEAEILLIPLVGHTLGHTGVAIRRANGWLLHCGDAYFHHGDVDTPRRCPLGLRAFQSLVQADSKARLANQARLRELARGHGDRVELVCSHDPAELRRAQHRGTP